MPVLGGHSLQLPLEIAERESLPLQGVGIKISDF
jgi:hypothetical protein